ncbi:MAG: glycosyltransferase family 4 protein [Acidobacteria bacterium]|nr:glycosyltransferase family 4 protein [Acidobacteriota bacterium]
MKLAFVVQRYGANIAGGSEGHCRELAERLASRHAITVLTTCATDYVTWENASPAGRSVENGVDILRFPVAHPRRMRAFAEISDEVFDRPAPRERQVEWFRENGPATPALLDHLRAHGHEFDLVLFWTFRYYHSYFGLPLVHQRAILVPTAEEDAAIDLDTLGEFFDTPAGYLFMTPEERDLVSKRALHPLPASAVVGIGIEPALVGNTPRAPLDLLDIPTSYLLYLGRVDKNKGCDALLDNFQEYASSRPDVTLVLAGPAKMQIPEHPQIRALGYVSDEVRSALLAHASALVVPSPYESLSIVLLEAWNHGVPALVNGQCKVLAGQVRRANGGLYYMFPAEFDEAADYLLTQHDERATLGRQGLAYIEREYRWPTVLARVEDLMQQVYQARVPASGDRWGCSASGSPRSPRTRPRSADTPAGRSVPNRRPDRR